MMLCTEYSKLCSKKRTKLGLADKAGLRMWQLNSLHHFFGFSNFFSGVAQRSPWSISKKYIRGSWSA